MNRPNAEDVQQQPPREQERAREPGVRRPGAAYRATSSEAPWRPIEMERLKEVGRNLGAQLDDQVRKRPYVVLGAAVGVGFVAGSILGSRLGQMLLAVGIGYGAKRVLGEDFGIERIQAELEKLTGEGERMSGRT